MSKNGQKKGSGKKALVALPLAAILAVVAWMQGCVGDIADAIGVFSGGGASGPTAEADAQNDNKTEDPSKENQDATPTPAKDQNDEQGSQENKDIRITVEGTKVMIGGTEVAFDSNDLSSLTAALTTKLSELIADDKTVYLIDQSGDYNVSEEVRKVLNGLGITPVEQK